MIAVGNLFANPGAPTKSDATTEHIRADALAATLTRLRLDAVVAGSADQRYARDELEAWLHAAHPLVLGQRIPAHDDEPTPALDAMQHGVIVHVGARRIGLIALEDEPDKAAQDRMQRAISQLRELGAQLVIAIADHAPPAIPPEIAADVMLHADPASTQQRAAVREQSGVLDLVAASAREHVMVVDLQWSRHTLPWKVAVNLDPTRSERGGSAVVQSFELDERVPPDAETRALLTQSFARINAYNAEHAATPRPARADEARYMGSDTCAACHTEAYYWWRSTGHGRAFETLVARGREFDLDCISCHVTGFDQPGGSSIAQLEHLTGVGCESCHGAGSMHADNPRPPHRDIKRKVTEQSCRTCHDPEHSEGFSYQRARAKLLGPGHRFAL